MKHNYNVLAFAGLILVLITAMAGCSTKSPLAQEADAKKEQSEAKRLSLNEDSASDLLLEWQKLNRV